MKNVPSMIALVLMGMCFSACSPKEDTGTPKISEPTEKTDEVASVSEWITDFEQAKAQSKSSGKPIFALFTGSDWCGWCIALHDEVLKTEEFKAFAAKELVLFEADFPRSKKISMELREQNQKLAQEYGIQGFPTVLIMDAEGKSLAQTGYQSGGGAKYVEHLKGLLNK